MQKILGLATIAATLVTTIPSASADGSRRLWRGSRYPVGLISRNVVTPYYYGYYGSHYSYVAPDPVPGPTYYVYPPVDCLLWLLVLLTVPASRPAAPASRTKNLVLGGGGISGADRKQTLIKY